MFLGLFELRIMVSWGCQDQIHQHACSVTQSRRTLCNSMDCSPPAFSVCGIFRARILEWIAISYSTGSSWPWIKPESPALADESFTTEPPGKPQISQQPFMNSETLYSYGGIILFTSDYLLHAQGCQMNRGKLRRLWGTYSVGQLCTLVSPALHLF